MSFIWLFTFATFFSLSACGGGGGGSSNVSPIFTSSSGTNVSENQLDAGYLPTIDDPDSTNLSYEINGGDDSALFSIDSATGALSFLSAPDFENPGDLNSDNVYNVQVGVDDGDGGSASQLVNITVTDVGGSTDTVNSVPVFTSNENAVVEENNTSTSYTAAVTDSDGDSITFSITGGADQSLFSINSTTGVLQFIEDADFETPLDDDSNNIYQIEITADDGNGGLITHSVEITVTDIVRALAINLTYPTAQANLGGEPTQTIVAGKIVDIEGSTVTADDITSLTVNSTLATFSLSEPSQWSVLVPVTTGSNDLSVSFIDGDGQTLDLIQTIDNQAVMAEPRGVALDSSNDRILVIDDDMRALVSIDLDTGLRSTISDQNKGSGTDFNEPYDVVLDSTNNRALVIDRGENALFGVDLATGNRTVLSSDSVGSGTNLSFPSGIVFDSTNDRALVVDGSVDALFAIDLTNGDRTIISNSGTGTGTNLDNPGAIIFDNSGDSVLVVDSQVSALFSINLSTGNRIIISDSVTGSGDNFGVPAGIALDDANNRVLIPDTRQLLAVDLTTGNRTVIADTTLSNGFNVGQLSGIAIDVTGNQALVADFGLDQIFSIDLNTGDQSILTSSSVGNGRALSAPAGVALNEVDGLVYIIDDTSGLLSLDTATGDRTTIEVSGTSIFKPTSIAIDTSNNQALVTDSFKDALFAIDLTSGSQVILSDSTNGTGDNYAIPADVVVDSSNNRALIVDSNSGTRALTATDLNSGNRTIISNGSTGSGTDFGFMTGLTLDSTNDRALVSDRGSNDIFAVDLSTGDRTIISNSVTGLGPDFDSVRGIALDSANDRVFVSNAKNLPDIGDPSILAVDLADGTRALYSSNIFGDSVNLFEPGAMAFDESNSRLFILDLKTDMLFVMDLMTGQRAVAAK